MDRAARSGRTSCHRDERTFLVGDLACRDRPSEPLLSHRADPPTARLLDDGRARATDLGDRALSARATELEQGFPFGVVRQLFERPLLEADSKERDGWLAGAAGLAAGVLA